MHNHETENYKCPICFVAKGVEGDFPYTKQADIIYKDDEILAFIASHWWPNNSGHVMVAPVKHFENVYDIPDELLSRVQTFGKKVAIAIRETYGCDGTSFRQHNEPDGGQDLWHYHLHVFPRYKGDQLYQQIDLLRRTDPSERIEYANRLRNFLQG